MDNIIIGILTVFVIMLTLKWFSIVEHNAAGYYYDRKNKAWVYGKKK